MLEVKLTAKILSFPATADSQSAHDRAKSQRHRGQRLYTLADIIDLAGLFHLKNRAAINSIRDLTEQRKLPPPITARRCRGTVLRGAKAIGKKALWDAAAVDLALNPEPRPPHAAQALPPALRDRMRSRAAQIA